MSEAEDTKKAGGRDGIVPFGIALLDTGFSFSWKSITFSEPSNGFKVFVARGKTESIVTAVL